MRIFLAAPLFNEGERDFNSKIAKKLREKGFDVWLAQETSFVCEGSHKEKKEIYEVDVQALKASDVILAVLDGVEVDPGVAYEMGFAKAIGKPILGLRTDYRTFSKIEDVNLMLEVSLDRICKSIEEVISSLIESGAASEKSISRE